MTFSEPIEKELLRSTQIKMVYLIFKKLFKLKEREVTHLLVVHCVHLLSPLPWVGGHHQESSHKKLKPGQLCYGAGKHKLEKMDWSLDDYAIDSGDTICPV